MSEQSIEYSLNTPVFRKINKIDSIDKNILNYDLMELIKNNNIIGGDGSGSGSGSEGGGWGLNMELSNCIGLLIGIIIIIVGFVLLWFKNDWVEIDAVIVQSHHYNENGEDNNTCTDTENKQGEQNKQDKKDKEGKEGKEGKCKIHIMYSIDSIEYSKIITVEKNDILAKSKSNSKIKIYYQKTNPKLIQLFKQNYTTIGISMILIGSLVIIYSMNTNTTNTEQIL